MQIEHARELPNEGCWRLVEGWRRFAEFVGAEWYWRILLSRFGCREN